MNEPITNAIWRQILFFIAIPFLVVLGLLLLAIVNSIYESKTSLANHLLVNKTRFSVEHLKFTLDNVRLAAESGATRLSRIDTSKPDARRQAEEVIRQMLHNNNIYNAWLVYEPDAFDGKDAMNRDNRPGAPSGRFIRSYFKDGEKILLTPSIDERTLDLPQEALWYKGAMNSKKPYINIDGTMLHDFQNGEGLQNLYAITIPLFRGEVPIGCIGVAGKLDLLFSGLDRKTHVSSLLLTETLHLTGASSIENIGKSLDEVGLSNSALIQQALQEGKPVFFKDAHFDMVGGKAMISFEPVRLEPFGKLLWIVTALPLSSIYASMYLVAALTIGAMIFFTLLLLFSLRHVAQNVSSPIRAMRHIADEFNPEDTAGAQETLHWENNFEPIAVSFHQMLMALRRHIGEVMWQQEILDFHLLLERSLFPAVDLPDFFRCAAPHFVSVYRAKSATLRLYGAHAETVVHYDPASGFGADNEDLERWQTALYMPLQECGRTGILWYHDAGKSAGDPSRSVCAFPLRKAKGELAGAIFLCFDAPLSDEVRYNATLMAEEIAHRLAGQEMSLE
ncbi:MAG: cache domain-containing protein [Zoogloeaceae bacterium]|jgi:hypothetical protein|nr:cache domain-containing protein [Zoogloeaceae bacterium]